MADDLYDKLMRELKRARDNGVNYQTAKARLREMVNEDRDRNLNMFFNNWFNHNWSRKPTADIHVMPSRKPYKPRPKPTAEQERDRRKADANMLGLSLMNWFLPDGETRLKDATGKQVRELGGWFMLIAKHVRPNEIVGVKLTAEQLFNLHEQHFAKAA